MTSRSDREAGTQRANSQEEHGLSHGVTGIDPQCPEAFEHLLLGCVRPEGDETPIMFFQKFLDVSETDTPSSDFSPADYAYDAQGRVTSETTGSESELDYAQDPSGNLTTLPTGASATYDDASALTSSLLSDTTTDFSAGVGRILMLSGGK